MKDGWQRVSKARRCPICDKPDWCLIASDGSAAICARTTSEKRCGEAGWLHRLVDRPYRLTGRLVRRIPASIPIRKDLATLAASYQAAVDPAKLEELARGLGLSVPALQAFGIGWSIQHGAWSFPMVDVTGQVLGVRLRRPNGSKFAVTGSREGLFIPQPNTISSTRLLICEGPTDAAALLDLGFSEVVGRPSCTGGVRLLIDLARRRRPQEAVIMADSDVPGQRGADDLASKLMAYVSVVRVIIPPTGIKDARDWLRSGGTHQDVQAAIEAAPIRRLVFRSSIEKGQ